MSNTKEVKTGSNIWFCQKSGSAFVAKFKNNKNYFVSKINKSTILNDYTEIKNGENFCITHTEVIKDMNYTCILYLLREKDKKEIIIRWEDLFHFCTK